MYINVVHKKVHKLSIQINSKKIKDLLKLRPKSVQLKEPIRKRSFRLSFYFGMKPNKKPIQRDVSLSEIEYYHSPNNAFEKQRNREAHKEAKAILEQIRTSMRQDTYPILKTARFLSSQENDFIRFYIDEIEKNKSYSDNTVQGHLSVIKQLKGFIQDDILPFNAINNRFIIDFYDYLKNNINTTGKKIPLSTTNSYHRRFYNYLGNAERVGLVDLPKDNPTTYLKSKSKDSDYLTFKELDSLIATPEEDFRLRGAFLFACFTGLAHAEVRNLKYSDIHEKDNGGFEIHLVRQKTEEPNKIPVSEDAMAIIEKRKEIFGGQPDNRIFKGLKYNGYQNGKLQAWVYRAGINKKITPHCGRHTFAVGFYINSKYNTGQLMNLLGHKDLSTTQRYINKFLKNQDVDVSIMPSILKDRL